MNEINFTFSRTNFINEQSYNERTHAEAWEYGLPNFATEGLELDEVAKTISGGRGINRGIPFALGVSGETQPLELTYNYIYVKSMLNGYASITTIVESDDEHVNTSTVKWFKIYDRLNGDDLRHSSYVKEVFFESAGEDQFIFNINGQKTPPFNVSVLQSAWSKTEADARFERQSSLNIDYTEEDFSGMNMAEIINMVLSDFTDYGAGVIVGTTSSSNIPNLRTALIDLVSQFYGVTLSGILTMRLEVQGKGVNGGSKLVVSQNNGVSYAFDYDNWGTNYLTENSDAFKTQSINFGNIGAEEVANIGRLELNGNYGGRFLAGTTNISSVTQGSLFIDLDYSGGNTMFRVGRSGGSAGTRYTYLSSHTGAGTEEGALRIYHDTTNKVNHRVNGIGHQLAYLSDLTRQVVQQLQYQRSSELITIDSIEETDQEARTVKENKELSARRALVNKIDNDIVEELKQLVASVDSDITDIWEVEPVANVKKIVIAEIWEKYESEE